MESRRERSRGISKSVPMHAVALKKLGTAATHRGCALEIDVGRLIWGRGFKNLTPNPRALYYPKPKNGRPSGAAFSFARLGQNQQRRIPNVGA
jgi:hypothetical protein